MAGFNNELLEKIKVFEATALEKFEEIQSNVDPQKQTLALLKESMKVYEGYKQLVPKEYLYIFDKLFEIIDAKHLNGLGKLAIPRNQIKLSVTEILIMKHVLGINLNYYGSKDGNKKMFMQVKDNENLSIEETLADYRVSLPKRFIVQVVRIDGDQMDKVVLSPDKWNSQQLFVRLSNKAIDENYDSIKELMEQVITQVTKAEFEEHTNELEDSIRDISNLSMHETNNMSLNSRLLQTAKIENMESNMFSSPNFIGYLDKQPDTKQILDLQKNKLLPGLFNDTNLAELPKQSIYLVLDISNSTEYMGAYKVLDITANEVVKYLKSKFGIKNINIEILAYDDMMRNPIGQLGSFLIPDGGTATHLAFHCARSLLQKDAFEPSYDKRMYITEFNKQFSDDFDVFSSVFGDKPKDNHRGFFQDKKNLKQLQNAHIVSITDGVPNDMRKTISEAALINYQAINFTQLVAAYDLGNIDNIIQNQIFSALGADETVQNDADYIESFNQVAKVAGGENFVIWINERIAEAIISLVDISLGRNFLNQKTEEEKEQLLLMPPKE